MKQNQAFKALFSKELTALLHSPAVYAAAFVLYAGAAIPFVGSGYWFSAGFSDFRPFFLNLPFLFCIVIPLLAMNSWADEKKHGTDRLLAVYPVHKQLLAAAKAAALLVCFAGMTTLTMIIPLSVIPLVYFDFFSFFLSFCAVLCFGAAFTGWSLALANISAHTAVSFLLSFFTGLFFTVSHVFTQLLPMPTFLVKILTFCSFTLHFESAARGIFDTRDFFFYILLMISAQGLSVFILYAQEEQR